jgi:hypothetical protein
MPGRSSLHVEQPLKRLSAIEIGGRRVLLVRLELHREIAAGVPSGRSTRLA